MVYYPDSGDIQFFVWDRSRWEAIKNIFSEFKSVVLHRHIPDPRKMFFQHFLGLENAEVIEVPGLIKLAELVIPKKLESQKSEAFIPFCEDFVKAVIADKVSENHWLAIHVSSLETLPNSIFLPENNAARLQPPKLGDRVEALVALSPFPKKKSPCAVKAGFNEMASSPIFWQSRRKVTCLDSILVMKASVQALGSVKNIPL